MNFLVLSEGWRGEWLTPPGGRQGAGAGGRRMMLILGMMGAVLAGVLAEGIMALGSPDTAEDEDGADAPEAEDAPDARGEDAEAGDGDLLQEETAGAQGADEGMSDDGFVSDDRPEVPDLPRAQGGGDGDELITGGGAGDALAGGGGNDQIDAGAGGDTLSGGPGDDAVWAGAGDDLAEGGEGADRLEGQDGGDSLSGGAGPDWLAGHEGDDLLDGGAEADTLLGGGGADTLSGGAGPDWLAGGDGADQVQGGGGADVLDGNAGDDWLSGVFPEGDDAGADFLNGGAGDDTLAAGAGDVATGGDGADSFLLSHWLGEGGHATITDYDAAEDEIVLVYDPATHADPTVTVQPVAGTDRVTILLDGHEVATVYGAVAVQDIRLLAA